MNILELKTVVIQTTNDGGRSLEDVQKARKRARKRKASALRKKIEKLNDELAVLEMVLNNEDDEGYVEPIPKSDWKDLYGAVLWWRFPIIEPPYVGTPLDDDFPEHVTHFTRLQVPTQPRE